VTASADCTAVVWDAATGRELFKLKGHANGLSSARFSPDGRWIVTGAWDRTARLWDATTGAQILSMPHHAGVCSVSFSSDGQRVVTASPDETATVWDAASGNKLLPSIKAPSAMIKPRESSLGAGLPFAAAYSPDGNSIVTASQNQTANVRDARTGLLRFTLKGNSHWLSPRQEFVPLFADFSADGQWLITGGLDFNASVWGLADQTNLLTLKGHEAEIASPEQVESWRKEEAAAARRLEVALREQATPTAPDRTLGIKKWLVLGPIEFEGTNAEAALDQLLIPQEASVLPREGERVRVGPVKRVWTAMDLDDSHIDFQRRLGGTHKYCAVYAVCYVTSETAQSALHLLVDCASGHPFAGCPGHSRLKTVASLR
jgi:hypothetical protein